MGQWEAQGRISGPSPASTSPWWPAWGGEQGSLHFHDCETVAMAVTSFASVSLPSPDANVCIPVRILCSDFGFQISRPSVLCKFTLSISTIRFPSSKYQMWVDATMCFIFILIAVWFKQKHRQSGGYPSQCTKQNQVPSLASLVSRDTRMYW